VASINVTFPENEHYRQKGIISKYTISADESTKNNESKETEERNKIRFYA